MAGTLMTEVTLSASRALRNTVRWLTSVPAVNSSATSRALSPGLVINLPAMSVSGAFTSLAVLAPA